MFDTETEPTSESQPQKKMSRGKKATVVILAVVLVLVGGAVGFGWWVQNRLDGLIERIGDPFSDIESRPIIPDDVASQPGQPVNILVLGSDSRISAGDPSQWEAGAQRTDAIMLVHISGDRESAAAISIPRDTWVEIPRHGEAKINAAFSYGGPALMIETVEQLTDVTIDHFAITDFESFQTMTDALGGVTLNLSSPLEAGDRVIPAGEQRLTGEEALKYVRQRYNLSGGDFSRVQRQQNWMRAIMSEVFAKDILGDVGELTTFLETVASSVAVDDGFTIGEMRSLALSGRSLRPGDISFLTIPHAGTGWSDNGQSIVVWDEENSRPLFDAVKNDGLADYLASDPPGVTFLPGQPE